MNESIQITTSPTSGVALIFAERMRQINSEGYDAKHDDTHQTDELILAAVCYLCAASTFNIGEDVPWPWEEEGFKHTTPIRDLEKAGALVAAAIDQLHRLRVVKG